MNSSDFLFDGHDDDHVCDENCHKKNSVLEPLVFQLAQSIMNAANTRALPHMGLIQPSELANLACVKVLADLVKQGALYGSPYSAHHGVEAGREHLERCVYHLGLLFNAAWLNINKGKGKVKLTVVVVEE